MSQTCMKFPITPANFLTKQFEFDNDAVKKVHIYNILVLALQSNSRLNFDLEAPFEGWSAFSMDTLWVRFDGLLSDVFDTLSFTSSFIFVSAFQCTWGFCLFGPTKRSFDMAPNQKIFRNLRNHGIRDNFQEHGVLYKCILRLTSVEQS